MNSTAIQMLKHTVLVLARMVLLIWLGVSAILWLRQDSYIYPRGPYHNQPMVEFGHLKTAMLQTPSGVTLRYLQSPPSPGMPVVVFYHGNGDWVIQPQYALRRDSLEGVLDGLAAQGYGVIVAEFRGYSGIPGHRGEQSIVADAHLYVEHAHKTWPGQRVILWGMSMGAGTAAAVAADSAVDAVMLDAPFTSIRDIARSVFPYVPTSLLLTSPFDTMARIGHVSAPVFVMHGDLDRTIPVAMGHAVLAATPCPVGSLFLPTAQHTAFTTDYTGRAAAAVRAFMEGVRTGSIHRCALPVPDKVVQP